MKQQKKHLSSKKRSHFLEFFILNVFVFAGIGLLSFVLFKVSLFNPFTQAFKDFTFTDMFYSRIKTQDSIYKGPLVLINVENKNREEIAFLLQRLQEGQPKVIGLDIIFKERKDSAGDEVLKQTFARHNNIVYPYIASFDKSTGETRNHEYFQTQSTAFINVLGEDPQFSTIRYYYPVYDSIPAFTTALLQMYDPSKAADLFKKGNNKTEIRYYGNLQNFQYHTFDEVMNISFQPEALKDKILLLGYMGKADGTSNAMDEDRFFTPLNSRLSGRSHPDMYGSVIHANILRMALEKDYIYAFPPWLNLVLAFLLSWMVLPFFVRWYVHKPVWYHLWLVLAQFGFSILFLFFTILLYANANVKIESVNLLVAVFLAGDFILLFDALVKYARHKLKWNFHSKFFEGAH